MRLEGLPQLRVCLLPQNRRAVILVDDGSFSTVLPLVGHDVHNLSSARVAHAGHGGCLPRRWERASPTPPTTVPGWTCRITLAIVRVLA